MSPGAILLALLALLALGSAGSDFYYMDTLNRQTYPLDDEVETEHDDVEEKILKFLKLPDTPRPAKNHLKENAAPQFMMQLYKEVQKREGLEEIIPQSAMNSEEIGPEYRNLSFPANEDQVDEADIVISFVNHVGGHKIGLEHEEDKRFYFELDDIPRGSELRESELRVYKRHLSRELQNYFITVFRIDDPRDERFSLTMLDNLIVNSSYEGWLVFNVSSALDAWMSDVKSNHGLYLQVLSSSGEEILPHRIGLVNRHGEEKKQGFMVAFFKALESMTEQLPFIAKPKRRSKRSTSNLQTDYWQTPENGKYSNKHCQKRQLYVKFKRLRFDSWIIAPDGYPAFYCEGECSFPLNSHMNATNHAIVQTLVSLIQPKRFPKACCAPKSLSAITVLYFDETQNVVMKRYRNMVVQSCGCH